ncbi:selenocysteine-specific translation elongation factor [Bacillus shivajii]|uniref:selenocysteine-specific translation elongation factor n=1 Tax=Bacillus shivajii TaxID=1983719 RepID=UPI001CFACCE6|nr:selenocysteine-specific translation elongation factor [Bacillus shivajii]UCZ51611.1 selenocysteine-specific translation elongation factor [Bacillus shivajii]
MGENRYYTLGMAGHIDHGKTTLTKALTNIETDRLKEEKERAISIELGYALLKLTDDLTVSIIDVPGHEKFIRQMIAGVAGIDLVLLVVAADEGVMPQTVEHLEILHLLGIHKGLIVVTKSDLVEEDMIELIEADISDQVKGTFFENADLIFVDSVSKRGIDELRETIQTYLTNVPARDSSGVFRLPIDQVFTVHGQGTVVRGTVYEGEVHEGETLEILPQRQKVRARQLQVHHEAKDAGRAGQRVAINLGGVSKQDVQRGDVLVSTQYYSTTSTIDISLTTAHPLKYPLKQRGYIKLHIGTAEVYGKIVFFDRNDLIEGENVLCQLRLDKPIVTKRGDRFILRRPTPAETIGGGFVIDPVGEKYKFGEETINMLALKKEGTPKERIIDMLKKEKGMEVDSLFKSVGIQNDEGKEVLDELIEANTVMKLSNIVVLEAIAEEMFEVIDEDLGHFHQQFPLREGKKKAELINDLKSYGKNLAELIIEEGFKTNRLKKSGQYIALPEFKPSFPKQWEKRMNQVLDTLEQQGLQVEPHEYITDRAGLPPEMQTELFHYLLRLNEVMELDEKHMITTKNFYSAASNLYENTNQEFSLQDAKAVLDLTRKHLVPFMEKLDELRLTKRQDNVRIWLNNPVNPKES